MGTFSIASIRPLDEFLILLVAVPTTIFHALGFLFSHVASSIRCMPEDP